MEFLREFKNYTLLDNITIEGLEALLEEYPELSIGDETTTLKLRYATLPQSDNWTIIEWNSDKNLSDEIYFFLYQNISNWLGGSHSPKTASISFDLGFEEETPLEPTFFAKPDPDNIDADTTVGMYEDEHFSYYLPNGDVEMGDEVALEFKFVDFLLDEYNFELDWLVDADNFEWVDFPITLEYDEF